MPYQIIGAQIRAIAAGEIGHRGDAWIELHYDLGAHGRDLLDFGLLGFTFLRRQRELAVVGVTDGTVSGNLAFDLRDGDFGRVYDIGIAFLERSDQMTFIENPR